MFSGLMSRWMTCDGGDTKLSEEPLAPGPWSEKADQHLQRPRSPAHILLMAEGCSPQDLVQVLPSGVQVQSTWVVLQVIQESPLHELEHQVPATATPPYLQEVHQVNVMQLLQDQQRNNQPDKRRSFTV